ncbi:hypothetical protein ACH5RR_026418 [Cinchona calisaya]|uniref:Transposase n=1 Tax=Cinchona calisaya TaxID=153742 RepID=A0ABD2Z4E8_9GENT
MVHGISKDYVTWVYHGESYQNDSDEKHILHEEFHDEDEDDDLDDMLNDLSRANCGEGWQDIGCSSSDLYCKADAYLRLLDDAKQHLYLGCKSFSKLSFIVSLLHLKTMSGWTIKSFDGLLEIFIKALPNSASVPKSFYECKKIIRDLRFKYEKIHACVNDCVLFRKEYASNTTCPNDKCKGPRFKEEGHKVPRKVLRYLPLKPRLQRLFVNDDLANEMRWHKEKRVDDNNIMRHLADSEA